jgi:c-di-GMP-binding flagellar brake protein YcgR
MPRGEMFYEEKRRHKRVNKKLKVIYRVMQGAEIGIIESEKAKKTVESLDISVCGIQLICDEQFEADQVLRLDVIVDGEDKPMATFAEVRWCRRDNQLAKYRIGMEFLVLKEDHINVIRKITGEA